MKLLDLILRRTEPPVPAVPDHQPLDYGAVRNLAEAALRSGSPDVRAEILDRLIRGIPGMTAPRPTSGPVHRRLVMLEQEYARGLASGKDRGAWIYRLGGILRGAWK